MDEEQLKEASRVAQSVTGISAYLYGIRYDKEQALHALGKALEMEVVFPERTAARKLLKEIETS